MVIADNRKNTKIRNTSQIYKNPDMIIKELDKLRYPKNIKYLISVHPHSKEYAGHSTQKPINLMEYLIKTYTNENETVLDFTMGSGTTGVACLNTNRNFIGIEMDDNYFKIAEERINKII